MINLEKKDPYKFTIGFKKQKPSHQRAAEILNQTSEKADLIASAVLSYLENADSQAVVVADIDNLRPWIQELIRKEVQYVVGNSGESKVKKENIMDLSEEKEMEDNGLALDLVDIMNSFRK